MQASNASNKFNWTHKNLVYLYQSRLLGYLVVQGICLIILAILFYGLIRWRLQQKFRLQLERSEKETQLWICATENSRAKTTKY